MSDLKILSPLKLAGLGEIKNRVCMAALTRARADNEEREANDLMLEYYKQRSTAGLIISEGVHISPGAVGWYNTTGIWTDAQVKAWKKINDAIHGDGGAKTVCQLWHQGRQSHSELCDGPLGVIAPSAIQCSGTLHLPSGKADFTTPRAVETDEIPSIIQEYNTAAANSLKAGFDGVEIHSANGYLLDTFLQSSTNRRTDAYGGSVENRLRMVEEVIEAVLEVVDAGKVGIKLSPNGSYGDMGSEDNHETFTAAIKMIAKHKLAFIEVMDGLSFGFHEKCEPFKLEQVSAAIKSVQGDNVVTHIIANCGYTRDSAEAAVSAGSCSAVSFGRAYISNPSLPLLFEKNGEMATDVVPTLWMTHGKGKEGYTDQARRLSLIDSSAREVERRLSHGEGPYVI